MQLDDLDRKATADFEGYVVRKDLVRTFSRQFPVPTYVVEFLLGRYCATTDEAEIQEGLDIVQRQLASRTVKAGEEELFKARARESGSVKIIDIITARLDSKTDSYLASLPSLRLTDVRLSPEMVKENERMLTGGFYAEVTLGYDASIAQEKNGRPFGVDALRAIQLSKREVLDVLAKGREQFTTAEWRDLLLRSVGFEPATLSERAKDALLLRMVPFVERNYNLVELGPRGTGKSHIYKEISPNSILVSGGQTTVANLFYNMGARKIGLVGLWDVVAFDEVAGINFKDHDGVQIMKDYMASGSFSRGRESINASASMVFVGNINQSVESLVKTSHLLAPFPEAMIDSAFFDRFHAYVPGWEIPKMRPEFFTNQYGLIVDYLAEWAREMRKRSFADAIDKYFKLGNNLNQRDTIAVRRTVSGLLKLLYPNGEYTKDAVRKCLEYALEVRRRVKEQLKKIGGMEFYDVHFSYIDLEDMQERFVSVPEQGGGGLIPEGRLQPGVLHTIALGSSEMPGVYRMEIQAMAGTGKLNVSGSILKEPVRVAFDYFKANAGRVSASIHPTEKDYHLHMVELQSSGTPEALTLTSFIALCSAALGKPVQGQLAVLGDMTLGGTITQARNLAESMQVAFDAGAKRILLPMSSVTDIPSVPGELFAKFQTSFYSDPVDAVFKALGVE